METQEYETATIEEVKATAEKVGFDFWYKEDEYFILCYPDMIGKDSIWNFGDSPYERADAINFMKERFPGKFEDW